MRSKQTNQTLATPARKAGNSLMGLGVATPIVGIAIVKMFRVIDYDIYPRVIQSIFIAALALFIAGILVKNYWKGGQAAAQKNPAGMWSTAYAFDQKSSFDWTGVGCSLMALGPGLFFVIGFLFAREFEYAAVVGFIALILFLLVGSKLYRLGQAGRDAKAQAEAIAKSRFASPAPFNFSVANSANTISESTNPKATRPQIIPGRRPEGYVLVDNSEGRACGLIFFGLFTLVWYGFTFIALFFVMTTKPDEGSTGGGILALMVFLLAGLIPLFLFIRSARAGLAFEKQAELLMPHWPLQAGEAVEMNFRSGLRRNLTMINIDVSLECKKTDRSGSETETTTLDKRSLTVREVKQDGKSIKGNWRMNLPTDWQLPYESDQQAIAWQTFVSVELAEGPKGVFSFPLLVVPKREIETGDPSNEEACG